MDQIFDSELLVKFKDRIYERFHDHNFLHHELSQRLADNIDGIANKFDSVLVINPMDGFLSSTISKSFCVNNIISVESGNKFAHGIKNSQCVVFDGENLPFCEQKFDLIVNNLGLHLINGIPEFLSKIFLLLKPGGIFTCTLFGSENLMELKRAFYEAELEIEGRTSPRFAPAIDAETSASILQKIGFLDPISMSEKIDVEYFDIKNLILDLKMMGQGNILRKRARKFFSKKLLNAVIKNYDGKIASFDIITLIGKKPA